MGDDVARTPGDEMPDIDTDNAVDVSGPETDLGNTRDEDEDEKERIIER